MKILHTGDLHLQALEDRRWQALKSIISICNEENVDLLIIAGDLFDSSANAEDLRPHIRDLLSGGSYDTVIIPGNHDHESFKPGFYFGKRVSVLNDPDWRENVLDFDDVRLVGIPFEQLDAMEVSRRLEELADHLDKNRTNILLFHGELLDAFFDRGDFGPEETKRYMPVHLSSFEELPVDYVLAGHFHAKFDVWRIGEAGYFVYPGSPISITKRELGARKVNLFRVGEPPSEHVLNTPHFIAVNVRLNPFDALKPTDAIRQSLSDMETSSMALIRVVGYVAQAEEELVDEIDSLILEFPFDVEIEYEFRDIARVLRHPLFEMFQEELAQADCSDEQAEQLKEMAIQAMIEAEI
jgi:DNA repair exonuclease SbcCD nuclease subunit